MEAVVEGVASEVRVRVGSAPDLCAVLALERRSAGAPHWGEAVYRGILDCPEESGDPGGIRAGRLLWIAELRGGLAGFVVASGPVAGTAEMESVLVAEELRGQGIGRLLCCAVTGWAAEMGAEALELEVRLSSGALRLYRGLGFVEVGRRRAYYRDPEEDAVLMRLEL